VSSRLFDFLQAIGLVQLSSSVFVVINSTVWHWPSNWVFGIWPSTSTDIWYHVCC